MDQLRLQEGRLFQSECVVALYLDLKAVVNEMLMRASKDLKVKASMEAFDDEFCQGALELLYLLSPKGVKDYHSQSLFECAKTTARLLWPSENLLIARPPMSALFNGLFKRICKNDALSYYFSLDPIKQDFVVREAFRRTIVNDCLTIFENTCEKKEGLELVGPDDSESKMLYPDNNDDARSIVGSTLKSVLSSAKFLKPKCDKLQAACDAPQAACEAPQAACDAPQAACDAPCLPSYEEPLLNVDDEVGPDDSASQLKNFKDLSYDDVISIAGRTTSSIIPKIISSENKTSSGQSSVRQESVISSSSVMRKPLNVRKIVLDVNT